MFIRKFRILRSPLKLDDNRHRRGQDNLKSVCRPLPSSSPQAASLSLTRFCYSNKRRVPASVSNNTNYSWSLWKFCKLDLHTIYFDACFTKNNKYVFIFNTISHVRAFNKWLQVCPVCPDKFGGKIGNYRYKKT